MFSVFKLDRFFFSPHHFHESNNISFSCFLFRQCLLAIGGTLHVITRVNGIGPCGDDDAPTGTPVCSLWLDHWVVAVISPPYWKVSDDISFFELHFI